MATVVINSTNYDAYISLADSITYLQARIGADAWGTASDDERGKALVSATRRIQRYLAPLVETVPDPATDPAPDPLPDATAELGFILLGDSSAQDSADSGSNTKRVKAGSAEVEFFRPTIGDQTVLPTTVQELLNQYLESVGANALVSPPYASGVSEDGASFFDECSKSKLTEGLP